MYPLLLPASFSCFSPSSLTIALLTTASSWETGGILLESLSASAKIDHTRGGRWRTMLQHPCSTKQEVGLFPLSPVLPVFPGAFPVQHISLFSGNALLYYFICVASDVTCNQLMLQCRD
jgi:hypothetical protein